MQRAAAVAVATRPPFISDKVGVRQIGGDTHILYVRYMILLQKQAGSRETGSHTGRKMKG